MPFGLFKKKDDEPPQGGGSSVPATKGGAADAPGYTPDADKAAKFFDRARTVHESTNYQYAATLWLSGLRWEAGSMTGLDGFLKSASAYNNEHPKGFDRDTLKQFDGGKTDVDRYLHALLAWADSKFQDASLAVKAAEASSKLGLAEATHYVGSAALNLVRAKGKKDLLLRLMEAFRKVGAFDKAVEAGESAVRVDPADGALSTEVRNMAAQATMSRGGYESSGQAGGFRSNVKDLERQRKLEDAERIVKTEETIDRLVNEAAADVQRRPTDMPAISVYIKRLLERGRDEDERLAREIAGKAFETTKEFRFREMFGDISLRRKARKLGEFKVAAQQKADDPKAQELYRRAREQFTREELEEFKLRVEAYPTDMRWKYEVARRMLEVGQVDEAIPLLQRSAEDAKYRVASLTMLGDAFVKIQYVDEAVHALRQAMETHRVATDETGMGIQYGLLVALQAKATADRDLAAAQEADRIASAIGMQQFNYRDVRQRREAIKKVLGELRGGGGAG